MVPAAALGQDERVARPFILLLAVISNRLFGRPWEGGLDGPLRVMSDRKRGRNPERIRPFKVTL